VFGPDFGGGSLKLARYVAIVVCGSLICTGVAQANHAPVLDGSSERTLLDVKRVDKFGEFAARWNVDTYHSWGRKTIWDQGYIYVYLDTYGDSAPDYYAQIRAGYERIVAGLFDARTEQKIRALRLRRPNGHTAQVTVNLRNLRIGDSRALFRWYVQTTWTSNKCWYVCFDWAPDSAKNGIYVEEPLPVETP
jgi:hypothetical protein